MTEGAIATYLNESMKPYPFCPGCGHAIIGCKTVYKQGEGCAGILKEQCPAAVLDHTVSNLCYLEDGIDTAFHTVKVAMRFKIAYILSQAVKRH